MTDPLWFPETPQFLTGSCFSKLSGLRPVALMVRVQVSHSMRKGLDILPEWSFQDFKFLCCDEEVSGRSDLSYFLLPNLSTQGPYLRMFINPRYPKNERKNTLSPSLVYLSSLVLLHRRRRQTYEVIENSFSSEEFPLLNLLLFTQLAFFSCERSLHRPTYLNMGKTETQRH